MVSGCSELSHVGYYTFEAGVLVQWLKLPAWKVGDRGFEPHSGLKKHMFRPRSFVKINIVGASVTER